MTSLVDKRVLVVGGSSGIGLAVADLCLAEGAAVTIASRSTEKLQAAAQALGRQVAVQVLDSGDEPAVEAYLARSGTWDHVVVSAAQNKMGSVREMSLEDAKAGMDSKFWGAYRIARAARIAESGSLTLVAGGFAVRPSPNAVLQGAINAALEGLARGLALEFSPTRVNCVSPGLIDTPIWAHMEADARTAFFDKVAASLPAKRIGQPEDVAAAVLYLMKTPFATGSTLRIDGGGAIA